MEFEWQQVSSSLKDTSQHSGGSQQSCSLDCLHLYAYLEVLKYVYKSLGDNTHMVGWLFEFYGISTFVGYLMLNPFLNK